MAHSETNNSEQQQSGMSTLAQMLGMDRSANSPLRLSRQKVRISRDRLFDSALRVLELYGKNTQYLLEVEFFDEVGSGLGPTLEFYALVSREWQQKSLGLWYVATDSSSSNDGYMHSSQGLFPISSQTVDPTKRSSIERLFRIMGIFVAKSIIDVRLIDLPLNPLFLQLLFLEHGSDFKPTLSHLEQVDLKLASSLKSIIAEKDVSSLGLDFTLPGHSQVELKPNGAQTNVTTENVDEYARLVLDAFLGDGIRPWLSAFRSGFGEVLHPKALQYLFAEEIQDLFCTPKWQGPWKEEELYGNIKFDHGLSATHQTVRYFIQMLTSYSEAEQRLFLQFVTGCPRLPIGGFKALAPPLTIVRKTFEAPQRPDDYLPSVMTCVNYVKLPEYSSLDILRQKFNTAMQEGQGSFHLS